MLTSGQHQRLNRLRWTAFAVVGGAYILAFFHRFAPAAIAGDLQHDFAIQATALGSLSAMYFYVYTLMQLPTGVLADTLGPRRIVAVGGVLAGAGALLFASASSFTLAAAGRLLIGLGVSVAFISMLKLNAAWFSERKFGALTGFTLLLGNLGSLLAATPLAWLLQWASWREVFVVVGGVSLVLAGLAWWLVRDDPKAVGLPSPRELEGQPAHPAHHGHWFEGVLIVARNRLTWPGFFLNLGVAGSLFAFAGLWAIPYLMQSHGWSRALAAQHSTLLLAAFAIGAFLIGAGSDRLGYRKPVILIACAVYIVSWLPLVLGWALSPGYSHALFFIMGLGASGFTLSWAAAKEVNRHALAGTATSLVNTGAFLGAAILQPLAGWVIEHHGMAAGIQLLAAAALLGTLAGFSLRETRCRYLVAHSGPSRSA